jgi:Ca-activated chloride channel homolog
MKFIFSIMLLLFLIIDPTKIGKINSAKASAKKAFIAGDYKTALEKYKYLTDSLGVKEDEVMMNMANAYFNLNDTANAMTAYQKLLSSQNKTLKSNAYQQLGVLSNRQNRLEEALSQFKEALKTDGTNEDARYNYEMVKKKLEEQKKQEQQNKDKNNDKEKDEEKKENQDQKKDDKQNQDKNKQDQEKKDQEKKDQEKKEQEKKEQAEKDKQEKEKKEQQEKEAKENEEKKNQKDKKDNFNPDKLKDMKVTEEKAKMILEAMKNQEVQYLQQNKRKATKPRDKGKPDW